MKRKIFSKLLMGAFLIASVSSFVSCKDYDDDINDLKDDIAKLALQSTVDNLQSQLSTAASTAQSALAKAEAAATQTALADVKAEATKAGENAAKGISDAANAQTAADAAAAAAKAANDLAAQAQAAADAAAKAAADAAAAGATKETVAAVEAEAKAAAEAAAAAAKAAEEKAAAAQAAAEDAAKKLAAEAQVAATNAANAYTDAEIAKIKADIAKITFEEKDEKAMAEINKILPEVAKIASLQAEVAKIAGLSSDLDDLKQQIANLKVAVGDTSAIDALTIKVNGYQSAIEALFSAVTSVELVESFSSLANQGRRLGWAGSSIPLALTHGTIGQSSVFGDNEAWTAAAPLKTYVQGEDIKFDQGIIVRVNPVTADLTNAKILLVNSKGNAIDDYVVAGTPYRYNGIITRGSSIGNGLWVIPFEMAKTGVTAREFYDNVERYGWRYNALDALVVAGDPILYAIAVNNTDENDNDRYVVSSYDVTTTYNPYVAARTFAYKVNNTQLENIRNRWDGTKTLAEGANLAAYPEQIWATTATAHPTPATAIVSTPATNKNVLDASDTNAQTVNGGITFAAGGKVADIRDMTTGGKVPLPVEIGKPFTINSISAYTKEAIYEADGTTNYANADTRVEWYYVVLDKTHAIESAPSEENAWLSYDITGLNTVVKATESLEITINSTAAKGDIIGFRVYAVNYDGTLADPDGRAFYVIPGDPANANAVNVSYVATQTAATGVASNASVKAATNKNNSQMIEIPDGVTFTDNNGVGFNSYGSNVITAASFPSYLGNDITVKWGLYKADNTAATKWSEVNKIKVVVENPQNMVDNSTVYFTINGLADAAHGNAIVNSLTVNVTKELPSSNNYTPEWRSTLEPDENGILTVYPLAAQDGTTATATLAAVKWPAAANRQKTWNVATTGIKYVSVDLAGYVNDLNAGDAYWVVENVTQNGTAAIRTIQGAVTADVEAADLFDNYVLKMDKVMIGETVNAYIKVSYKKISATTLAKTGAAAEDVPFTAWSGKIYFADAVEKLLKLDAAYYIGNYLTTTKTSDDKIPAKSNAYYYFWKDNDGQLWGYQGGAYTQDINLLKWVDDNYTWNTTAKTVAYATAPAAYITTNATYKYAEIFSPVWGSRSVAADVKRQVLAEYVGLYDVANNDFPGGVTLTNYLSFVAPTLSETAPVAKTSTTLIEAANSPTTGTVTGFTLQNLTGNVPTGDVTVRLKIKGTDVFGYTIDDDNLSMTFTIKPLQKTDY